MRDLPSNASRALFTRDEIERGRRYNRPLYLALPLDVGLTLTLLALLALGRPGDVLLSTLDGLPWWAAALAASASVVAALALVRLPLSFWRGYLRERRWGLSTQGLAGWLADWAKGLGLGVVLTAGAVLGLLTLIHSLRGPWPIAAAPAAAGLVLVLGFVSPLVLEPLFNRFAPLRDEALRDDLLALARRAGAPVRDVLVADASRRTRKENAYVSGLGSSRRVVVFDTLLERGEPRHVRVVVAHELGHRRERHVAKLTLVGMAGAAAFVVVLWLLLASERVLDAAGAHDAADVRVVPLVLFAGTVLELLALPFAAALSRRWERVADRLALELTGDPEAVEAVFRRLAAANVAELDPPRLVRLLLATHPPIPERIAAARLASRAGRSGSRA